MVQIFSQYWPAFAQGLGVTLMLAGTAWFLGFALGLPLGLLASTQPRLLGSALKICGFLFSALPALAVLFWMHYPAQEILGIVVPPAITTGVFLSILNIVLVGNITYASVTELPPELSITCKISAMSDRDAFYKVLLPTALRSASPAFLATQLTILHMTLFGSLISVEELFRVSQRINALEYKPVEIYTIMAIMFAVVCLPLAWAQHYAAQRAATL
jgi:polar amino acid transport system permease protein